MGGMSTARMAALAVGALVFPLAVLFGRAWFGLVVDPAPPEALLLDIGILACGVAGIATMLAVHLRSALVRPLADIDDQMRALAAGRFEERVLPGGPREFQELAETANGASDAVEQRMHEVTQRSGVLAMGAVLAGVAHEVANPLAQMRFTLDTLMRAAQAEAGHGDSPSREGLERLARGVERLADTVVTLRDAGARSGPHETARIVKAAVIIAQQSLLACDVEVEHGATRRVEGDPSEVIQAIVAILRNAGESRAKRVWLRSRDDGEAVVVEVRDDGDGVPAVLEERLVDPFVTTKAGHVGLGLTHADRIARAHGGTVAIRTGGEGGICVELRLAGVPGSRSVEGAATKRRAAVGPRPARNGGAVAAADTAAPNPAHNGGADPAMDSAASRTSRRRAALQPEARRPQA